MCKDLNEFIYNYNEAADDYQLIVTRKLRYFHHEVCREAKTFYHSNVESTESTFSTAPLQM